MLISLTRKIFGTQNERELKSMSPLIAKINELESTISTLTDDGLKAKTVEFKKRISEGESLDALLPEAFAVCREGSKRILGMRHYDVQLIGGIALHRGRISEMRTGEGKTLVATLPCYLNALTGRGVHVITVNDYLATRDAEWMGRLYKFLGLSVGVIVHGKDDHERQENYRCDIVYGTNNEFGFDYLRDNMKFRLEDYVQRELNYAIVDEVDSILIDEARTPLIISGPTDENSEKYTTVNKIVPYLRMTEHFTTDEKSKTVSLTEDGISKVEELLNVQNLYDPVNIDTLHHVYQALKAHIMFKLDVDYVVRDGKVVIVDEFTGRIMPGRRWSDGLHQAVEAKEGVDIENENQTLASITFQNYFRMYNKLAGMTGTADTESVEFKKIYNLDVMVIPTNKPIRRKDEDDMIYPDVSAKFNAIAKEIAVCHERGQPVLVGTVSIEKSERLSTLLKKLKIPHNVLNAKHHEREAEIIAQAGAYRSVTIATNMAGRGTDILLGGNPEFLAKREVPEEDQNYPEVLKKFKIHCDEEKQKVIAAGGLFIMGTERHESRRIDNQLRGRAGRQGDPGTSKFFLSLEDDLFRIFGGDRIKNLMGSSLQEDEPIVHPWLSRAIENAQKKVEGHNFDIRKHLLQYDDVMNQQRKIIYEMRKEILGNETQRDLIIDFLHFISEGMAVDYGSDKLSPDRWSWDELNSTLQSVFHPTLSISAADLQESSISGLHKAIFSKLEGKLLEKSEELGEFMPEVEKMFSLSTIDHLWKEHLKNMDHLREGIGLRGYAQKDPLLEYKKESFLMFKMMDSQIKQEVISKVLNVRIAPQQAEQEIERFEEKQMKNVPMKMHHGDAEETPQEPVRNDNKIGRNDPCHCGSGKKYKHCHGR
ncbi:MAG: preprotein translocase subunit SecA [Oligoflexia bacterium]|nr:preprotein translocase subunit SecA [Oligoflexia bacterium]